MIVVADTSPITALLHLRQLRLLTLLYGRVYVPGAVARELKTLAAFGYDVSFLQNESLLIVSSMAGKNTVAKLYDDLDEGATEAIALAMELNADLLLIDELLGKNVANRAGLLCKGVVGVLIEAKKQTFIPAVRPLLDDLRENLKFRLADNIYNLALQMAGEA